MLKTQRRMLCFTTLSLTMRLLCCHTSLFAQSVVYINPSGMTVETRFNLPEGYVRVSASKKSYTTFIRTIRMHRVYTNDLPENLSAGVLNIEKVKSHILQQDMQLSICFRGEYLFRREQYDKIAFTISSIGRVPYVPWVEGLKLTIGDKSYFTQRPVSVDRYQSFCDYLKFIFEHSNISTLLADVQPVANINDIMVGDMFIQETRPGYGHVVVVLDVAYNPVTKDRVFLLAKTNQPPQVAYVLLNPQEAWSGSPWYSINVEGDKIVTPDFVFNKKDLRRFKEVPTTSQRR